MGFWTGYSWGTEPAAPQQAPPGRVRHALEAVAEAGLIALLIAGLVAGTTLAAKGSRTAASLTGPVMVADANSNGSANHGDAITFDVSSSAAKPYVGVRCYQGSAFVYDGYVGYYDAAWFDKHFTLDSGYWDAAESAACTARLFSYDKRGREKVQATKSFSVAP